MRNDETFLASNIKYLRIHQKLTQTQVGKLCGKTDKTISCWENGTREPNALDLKRIADIFNVSINDLLGRDMTIIDSNANHKLIQKIIFQLNQNKDLLVAKDLNHILFIIEQAILENNKTV